VALLQTRGIDHERRVWIPDDQVRVEPGRNAPFPLAQARQRRRRRAHPPREIAQCASLLRRSADTVGLPRRSAEGAKAGVSRRQRQLERGDAAPRAQEIARGLERRRRGRMVGGDQIERAVARAVPQRVAMRRARESAART
jgi:hypothetical protein